MLYLLFALFLALAVAGGSYLVWSGKAPGWGGRDRLATPTDDASTVITPTIDSPSLASPQQRPNSSLPPDSWGKAVTMTAVADIACPPGETPTPVRCQHAAVAALVTAMDPTKVLVPGDLQYESGSLAEFAEFNRTWGHLRSRLLPVPGNHELNTPGGQGYEQNFGISIDPYVRDVGTWKFFFLNSNCRATGCASQAEWLTEALSKVPSGVCTGVLWHHPRWSAGKYGPQDFVDPLWQASATGGVDLVLNGHEHSYMRHRPLDASGTPTKTGPIQFIVGTGGKNHYPIAGSSTGMAAAIPDQFGATKFQLYAKGFTWEFVSIAGRTLDSGAEACI